MCIRDRHKSEITNLASKLEENSDIKTFIAHKDIEPAKEWQEKILDALETMDFFIGIVTPDFHKGSWTDQEIGYSIKKDVPRLFLKLGESAPKGFIASKQAMSGSWEEFPHKILDHLYHNKFI